MTDMPATGIGETDAAAADRGRTATEGQAEHPTPVPPAEVPPAEVPRAEVPPAQALPAQAPPAQARNETRGTVLADRLEVGESFWARFRGLMGRRALPAGGGLWLPGDTGVHMLFMRFPIDAVFLSRRDGEDLRRVVAVRRGLRPWTGVVWLVRGAVGVLELPAGTLEATGTQPGDAVRIG